MHLSVCKNWVATKCKYERCRATSCEPSSMPCACRAVHAAREGSAKQQSGPAGRAGNQKICTAKHGTWCDATGVWKVFNMWQASSTC